jgi:hypothetical protein
MVWTAARRHIFGENEACVASPGVLAALEC